MIKITVNFKRYVITILTFNIYALMVDSGFLIGAMWEHEKLKQFWYMIFNIYALMVDSGILVGGYVGAWKYKQFWYM